MECYLDNSATTRTADEVVKIMIEAMQVNFGNPSSKHMKGVDGEKYVKEAASIIAKSLKVLDKEILFTSGGTESNNTAIIGTAMANKRKGNHVIVSSVEHASVKEPFNFLEREGFRVTYLPVNSEGIVDLEALKDALDDETILVSCMHVNNEIGAVEPIEEIGRIVKEYNPDIIYHVDAIQSYGKYKIYPKKLGIDLLSVSGHKIHGPKGSGFLFIKDKTRIKPIIYGGGQQKGMRSGTENVPAIAGLGKAVELIYNEYFDEKINHLYEIKDYLIDGLTKIEDVKINSKKGDLSAPQIVSASFKNVRAEVLLHALEEKEIYVSSGSACSSNKPGLSNTLVAIGLPNDLLDSTIRFSFNYGTSKEEIDYTLEVLNTLVPQLRRFIRR
ncbi:cysteine desulfurase family protein [Lachnospira multipara]|uniref:cysteine desulfurase family protein n=1 Tax=Lachnospira multipara TaxID=28051 RepID=UPI00047FC1A3|nr:cysteine desulfurase family protein [Lachnospira multipara]